MSCVRKVKRTNTRKFIRKLNSHLLGLFYRGISDHVITKLNHNCRVLSFRGGRHFWGKISWITLILQIKSKCPFQ